MARARIERWRGVGRVRVVRDSRGRIKSWRPIGRKRKPRKSRRRLRARDFGDNPKIRRRFGEAEKFDKRQPWEVYYRRRKKRLIKSLLGR